MNAELYRVFYQVGLYLSFSKAAQAMGVSQSAISQSIKQLEKILGFPLFVRTTKSDTFTKRGEELFFAVAKSFSLLTDAVAQIQERNDYEKSAFRIAAGDTLCSYYLLPYFSAWQKRQKQNGLVIINRPSLACIELVREEKVEAAVIALNEEVRKDQGLDVIPLFDLHDIFVGGPQYKGKVFREVKEIAQEPLIVLEKGSIIRSAFDEIMAGCFYKANIEVGSMEVLIRFLKLGMGVSLLPKEYVQPELKSGALQEIKTKIPVGPHTIGLIKSRRRPTSGGLAAFIDELSK